MMDKKDELRNLPGVDKLLTHPVIRDLIGPNSRNLVIYAIRESLEVIREEVLAGKNLPPAEEIVARVGAKLDGITGHSLRRVINATGIVVHTNLGRAPLGDRIIAQASEILKGYSNLEFDLETGERGSRNRHLSELLKFLTGAEDVLVVNNNAAALMLILQTFSRNREVIVSRGELIEIGGSFRLPDIMAASGCIMREVGTTNKTRISDYERAVNDQTALLLKAHCSNYVIRGFAEEAGLPEMVRLGKKIKIPVVYDMGSGLLRKTPVTLLAGEPDVHETLATGVDLVCFSGDKLLGGTQAGIIAGKGEMIALLKKEPMLRALRIGKTSIAFLQAALSTYLDDETLTESNLLFGMIHKNKDEILQAAEKLRSLLTGSGMACEVVESLGQVGGGALPGEEIASYAVKLTPPLPTGTRKAAFVEKLFHELMKGEYPVIGILRKGEILFDLLTVDPAETGLLSGIIENTYKKISPQ